MLNAILYVNWDSIMLTQWHDLISYWIIYIFLLTWIVVNYYNTKLSL